MFDKKRIEIFIEKPVYKRAGRILRDAGVTGYSVLPVMAGFGNRQTWERGTDLSSSRDLVCIVSITTEAVCQKVVDDIENLLGNHIGILNVCDVKVIRDNQF